MSKFVPRYPEKAFVERWILVIFVPLTG